MGKFSQFLWSGLEVSEYNPFPNHAILQDEQNIQQHQEAEFWLGRFNCGGYKQLL